jgi:hypothetical protein
MGLKNSEVNFKLKDIDDKLRVLGGRLEVKTLEEFSKNFRAEGADPDESLETDSD